LEDKVKIIAAVVAVILLSSLFVNMRLLGIKKSLERERDSLKQEIEVLNKKIEEDAQEKRKLKDQIKELNKQSVELARQKDEFAQQCKMLTEARDSLIKQLQETNVKLEQEIKMRAYFETRLSESQNENSRLKNKNSELDIVLKDSLTKIEKLKKQLHFARISATMPAAPMDGNDAVQLPPISVPPQAQLYLDEAAPRIGKVVALNKENNFVVINLGANSGIKPGDSFTVRRGRNSIATVNVIQARNSVAACDIVSQALPVRIGDLIAK
jgi:septal ring factor EnvC (AmiA/AmiB activator)